MWPKDWHIRSPYLNIEHDHAQQIDLLIVVSQMLTGYDSKWVNTLYVDKVMKMWTLSSRSHVPTACLVGQAFRHYPLLLLPLHHGAEYQ